MVRNTIEHQDISVDTSREPEDLQKLLHIAERHHHILLKIIFGNPFVDCHIPFASCSTHYQQTKNDASI